MAKVQRKKPGSSGKASGKKSDLGVLPGKPVKNISFKIVALTAFVVSILLPVITYNFFGSFFEMNDDPRYVMAMKGFASPVPYNNFVSVYIFTSDLYIWLYQHYKEIPWYGYSMFFLIIGTLFNFFLAMYLFAKKRLSFTIITLLFIAFYFLVFFQNVYWINFTRPAILCTASFVFLLGALYVNSELFSKNKWILILPVITYILAHLTRLDGGYLGFVFSSVAVTLIVFFQKNIFPFLLKYLLPVITFIVIIKIVDINIQKSNKGNKDFLDKTEMIRQLIDYRNVGGYIPKDIKDTLAYNALMNARYCSDDKIISKEFLEKLSNESPLLQSGNKKKMEAEFGAFIKSLSNDNLVARNINIAFIVLLLLWYFISPAKESLKKLLAFIFLQMFFTGIVAGMSYYMKLPARIYNPLLVLITVSNILMMFSFLAFKNRKHYYMTILIFLGALIAIPGYMEANKKYISDYTKYGRVNHGIINEMNTFQNTIFILTTVRSWESHNATDPLNEINFKNNNCYVYLSIELSLAPETKDQMVDKFGTSDHNELFKKISAMDNVIWVASEDYNRFLGGYYYYNYGQQYYFEKVRNEKSTFYQFTGLDFYRVRKLQ